jgi:hypothetical protein
MFSPTEGDLRSPETPFRNSPSTCFADETLSHTHTKGLEHQLPHSSAHLQVKVIQVGSRGCIVQNVHSTRTQKHQIWIVGMLSSKRCRA